MTSEIYDTDIYSSATQSAVLTVSRVHPVRPTHPKTEVWMGAAAVRSTVALAAAACVCVALTVMASRPRVDVKEVAVETSADDDTPEWIEPIARRVREWRTLERGWDSYDAPPVTKSAVDNILAVLETITCAATPRPSVAPTPEGGVQIEWHQNGVDLELRTDGAGQVYAFFHDLRTNEIWDDVLETPDTAVVWIERLAVRV